MKYVYTQNLTQGSTASRSADPAYRKGYCKGWDADIFCHSRRSDPLCSRLPHLHDHKTGLEPDFPSGPDRSSCHGRYNRHRHY